MFGTFPYGDIEIGGYFIQDVIAVVPVVSDFYYGNGQPTTPGPGQEGNSIYVGPHSIIPEMGDGNIVYGRSSPVVPSPNQGTFRYKKVS